MSEKRRRKPGIALLGRADTYIEAMMWKDRLEQKGIPCMVRDGSATIGEFQAALPGPGHMEVYVPASALQKAQSILGDALSMRQQPTVTPLVATVSWTWLLWILGPLLIGGVVVLVALLA
ncbi:MAG: DUF2007 domain-containing protein [Chloroflexota bacterium]